jgi:hypothetical protein
MKTQLFTAQNWLFAHRTHVQIALFAIVLTVALIALVAPGIIVRADQIIVSGH